MTPLYYRDANGAVLVYDVGDSETFKNIEYWLKELESKVRQ
jgi:GTPase SAR1 family protein